MILYKTRCVKPFKCLGRTIMPDTDITVHDSGNIQFEMTDGLSYFTDVVNYHQFNSTGSALVKLIKSKNS